MTRTPASPQRVLVVMPTWVGDAALATPLLESIHSTHPEAEIDLLIKPGLRGLLDGAPWLRRAIVIDKSRSMAQTARSLRVERYDWGVLLSNSFRPAALLALARVRRRIGYMRNARAWLLTDRLPYPKERPFRMVDFYGAIGDRLGLQGTRGPLRLHIEPRAGESADALLGEHGIGPGERIIGINPGAKYGSSKLWPVESFAQAGDGLAALGLGRIVVFAGPGEDELAGAIVSKMRAPAIALPSARVDLATLKAALGRVSLLISNDTGPRHMAAALGVRTVAIFGPTHTTWGDSGSPTTVNIFREVDCGPCMQRTCPLGHHKCIKQISADEVVEAGRRLLANAAPVQVRIHSNATGERSSCAPG